MEAPQIIADEYERLKTYPSKWKLGYNKGLLAKDGFFCVTAGVPAKVQCSFCSLRISVNQHPQNKTVREVHREQKPECPMNLAPAANTVNIPLLHTDIYKVEKDRLYSFLSVDFDWPVDINDLARTGFYYDPVKKSSCCVYCKLQIGSWTAGDTGKSEHLKYSPNCAFFKGDPSVENVKLGEEKLPESKKIIDAAMLEKSYASEQPSDLARHIVLEEPRHTGFVDKKARVNSFNLWPASMKQRPVELADAGFFYVGRGDRVACYQCGFGLQFWGAQDRPWNEHAYWFPECDLVKAVMGNEFIKKMQELKASGTKVSTITVVENPEGPEKDSGGADEEPMETCLEVGADDAIRTCKVCLNKELGIVFLPCAHMATCPDCAPQLTNCPICRCQFTAYVRAILP